MSALRVPPALDRGVHSWDAVKLADVYSQAELAAAITEIHADPAAANPAHATGKSIYLYTPAAQKRTEALSWAIFYIKQGVTRAAGEPA